MLALLVPLFPLLAGVISFFFRRLPGAFHATISVVLLIPSVVFAIVLFLYVHAHPGVVLRQVIPWLVLPSFSIHVGIQVNALTALMLVIVTFVSILVFMFSYGYLRTDERLSIYYSYLNLFVFSMLALVLSPNLLQLYLFWEMVGLCSYLLVGYWFAKPEAARAARKSFVVTRIGDAGLFAGILLLGFAAGTFNDAGYSILARHGTLALPWLSEPYLVTLATLLIFIGAVGKSAQLPLHVWLPDAMEGPTPVSALIHAATMVAAGVYLVAREFPLFAESHVTMTVVAYVGAGTALFASLIAITQQDIKRVIAYSTVSQLGYMMLALGIGAYADGVFHLFTHAFFKALLFLAAGSVIHALSGTQDLALMGGLRRKMPITFYTFLAGALALSGIFPFAGFWSKDAILGAAMAKGDWVLYLLGLIAAFCTAFYIFRVVFLTFAGAPRDEDLHAHAHEGGWVMTVPLVILGLFATFAGFINTPWNDDFLSRFLTATKTPKPIPASYSHWPLTSMAISLAVALCGIGLAAWMYGGGKGFRKVPSAFKPWYALSRNKFYVDEVYSWTVVRGGKLLAALVDLVDRYLIEGLTRLVGLFFYGIGNVLRYTQTGQIQTYGTFALVGLVVFLVVAVFRVGGVF
ncbi:MAG: NADH-quinone oxidoreductase subunit L [Alicyclobacillaceae bacterium]|nr:NADH-quinone oxidoreductase subunit L [Alicyclobacillaceae bacterium]